MSAFWQSYWLSLRSMVRDKGVLLLVLIGPIVYSFYYPFPYSPEIVREVPVAVVDLDHSSLSRKLVRLADASPDIEVTFVANNPAQLRQALWDGDVEGGLIIPRDFRRSVLRREMVKPVVLGNGAYFMFNRAEVLGFAGATQALSNAIDRKYELASSVSTDQVSERIQPVRLDLRAASNPTGGYSTYVVPAVAVIVLQQTLLLGICMLMGTWKETGAPFDLERRKNRLALVLAAATICFLNALYYVGLVYWREDYPHLGQFQHLLPVITLFSLTAGAWTVAVGSWVRYREQAVIHLLPTTIPFIFVAGFAWPVESIPASLRALSALVPSTAGIQGFLKVDQMGADLNQVLPELASLLMLLSGALALIALKKRWPARVET
ncbi:MAG: ABC transporter permease [Woeseiaceae bacterium]|nr:ABC transporter permease [Woeseiaceae bacterium]